MTKLIFSAALAAVAFSLSACGKGTAELNIASVGETMAYDQTALTVKSGQKVHLVLSNRATSPAMKHNWVLVQPGKEADVATAGMAAGEGAGYVPGATRTSSRIRPQPARRPSRGHVHGARRGRVSVHLHVPRALPVDARDADRHAVT